ncbi:MAG: MFS transporter [Kiritimatiellia bacterium]|nr:MFS transporter [Kiritimatiellia bacterium]
MSDTNTMPASVRRYAKYLLVMAGLGGLIYGIDVGVIAAALPYIRNTSNYSAVQLGFVVGAVLWGSVLSSLFAGSLAELFGRKKIIIASAFCFFISIPVICLSGLTDGGSFILLTVGRTLQGASAGLVGVVIPMYLAECLDSDSRGKGTGMFQLLLTIGLAFAAVIGLVVTGLVGDSDKVVKAKALENNVIVYEQKVDENQELVWADADKKVPVYVMDEQGQPKPKLDKDGNKIADLDKVDFAMIKSWVKPEQLKGWAMAWQIIFLCSAVPGLILFLGAFGLKESPRWLYKNNRKAEALASLAANNGDEKAKIILDEMIAADKAAEEEKAAVAAASQGDTLFQRKYVYPFCLAVVILACNQTTGINSVLNYTVDIFKATGMEGVFANFSDLAIKLVNVFMTIVACALVDKKGRKFLLKLGTSGIILGLSGVATMFLLITKGVVTASMTTGVISTAFFFMFIAFYAVGPGVCVWLALSELMPTRIRATGMSIAMIINQGVSATIATIFPAWKDAWGFPAVFYTLAGFTVVYFITAAFFLPETKGKTLEEIEKYFTKK